MTLGPIVVKPDDAPTFAEVETPEGDPVGTVFLAPSAGARRESPSLVFLAATFRGLGYRTVRFDFLYKAAGRSFPDPMPVCMACYRRVIEAVTEAHGPLGQVVLAGQSMGGRMASMLVAEGEPCDRLVCFAYPLHPEGKPDKRRDAHLPAIAVPTLIVNGTADALCTRDLMEAVLARLGPHVAMRWLDGTDHSLKPAKGSGRRRKEIEAEIAAVVAEWTVGKPHPARLPDEP